MRNGVLLRWLATLVVVVVGVLAYGLASDSAGIVAGKDEKTKGARLRISGLTGVPSIAGTNSWKQVSVEFSVADADPVLVLELRAEAGEAWFDRNSLTLTRIP